MSKFPRTRTSLVLGTAASVALLATGCSSLNDTLSGGKVDYRTSGAQTVKLDVPPDLSQLPGQSRFGQVQAGSVSATELAREANRRNPGAAANAAVAPNAVEGVRLVRDGQARWLAVNLPPEQVWPKVRNFWTELGFELTTEQAEAGVMETNFAENRAKVPQDGIRKALGRVFDMLYDTGERDQYRTRIERTAQGTEIYIAHRGLIEEYVDQQRKEQTTWRPRPSDPQLEAEMLARLMVKLGASQAAADAVVAQETRTATPPARGAELQADNNSLSLGVDFDTSWRRVGLALDRSGYTIESRDRNQGVYLVRVARPQTEAPGFFARLFGRDQNQGDGLSRYQIKVEAQGNRTLVRVLNEAGQQADTDASRRVTKQLQAELN